MLINFFLNQTNKYLYKAYRIEHYNRECFYFCAFVLIDNIIFFTIVHGPINYQQLESNDISFGFTLARNYEAATL